MVEHLRTLGIVAHIDAGKTTLTERILFDTGRQRFLGEVDDGTATMDWMRQEQERGISIVAAATRVSWGDHELQIVDTPGHVDFTFEVERCLRVLDAVVVVLDATRGVESQTQTVWRQADRWRCARLVLVNKMDRVGADYAAALAALAQRFDCRPVPVTVPLFDERGAFAGLGEPVAGTAVWFHGEMPDRLQARFAAELRAARDQVVEACADFDDSILADFVAGRGVDAERLRRALRVGCIRGGLVPVLAGSALHGHGVDLLLDAMCDLLPSPIDRDRTGLEAAFPPARQQDPPCALVFKVEHQDDEVRNYVRVFAGALAPGDEVVCARTGATLRVPELWTMHASHHEAVDAAGPGAIVVLAGALDVQTGDTLHAPGHRRVLPMPAFPPPVLAAVFEPATQEAEQPLLRALCELLVDDPTLQVDRDAETGLPLVLAMGELHLEITAARLRERIGPVFAMSPPRVARRVTVRVAGVGEATVVTPGTPAREARAVVAVEPGEDPERVVVDVGPLGAHPLAPVLRAQLEELARSGGPFGSPAAGLRIEVRGVAVDAAGAGGGPAAGGSDEALLHQAIGVALDKALAVAGREELEPGVEFAVRCPDEHRSAVLADLLARGATMRQISSGQLGALLQGRGRLRSFLGYATRLRSLTRGMGEVQLLPRGLVLPGGRGEEGAPPEPPLPPAI
ncbi:MAG: GTP-binding protein [Planctomycetota bacterium]